MGLRGGPLDFAGLGGVALVVVIALAIAGIICALRGFWGTSRRARWCAVLAGVLTLPVGATVGALLVIQGFNQIAMLGPAATPTDLGYVYRRALSPVIAACLAFCAIACIAGVGWVRERGDERGDEPPPRKPLR